jgi:ADP-ribose pyrophosphatase YjhB (NUDIX family)
LPRDMSGEWADAILVTETNQYLMKRRDDLPCLIFPNQWSFLGDGLERGETSEQALHRELLEEPDLRGRTSRLSPIGEVTLPFPTPRVEHVDFFAAPSRSRSRSVHLVGENRDAASSPPKNLPCPSMLRWCRSTHGAINSSGRRLLFPAAGVSTPRKTRRNSLPPYFRMIGCCRKAFRSRMTARLVTPGTAT